MFKDKQHMLNELLRLMDKIREHLKRDNNIDNFIDNNNEYVMNHEYNDML